jgi:WD40 repeat protein
MVKGWLLKEKLNKKKKTNKKEVNKSEEETKTNSRQFNCNELEFGGYISKVNSIVFDSTGRFWASGGGTEATIWDVKNEDKFLQITLARHENLITDLQFKPQSTLLATTAKDGALYLWELKKAKSVQKFPIAKFHLPVQPNTPEAESFPRKVCWNEEGDKMVITYSAGEFVILDLASYQ